MYPPQNANLTCYQSLGKLFYAIAAADKVIRDAEYDTLKEIVKSKWAKVDDKKDNHGSDAAYQIETVFDWLDYKKLDAQDCFKEFEVVKMENEAFFNPQTNQLIMNTAIKIANSFSGINKSEHTLLFRLQKLLN